MTAPHTFIPPRRIGLAVHLIMVLILISTGAWGLWRAAYAYEGFAFLLGLLPGLLAVPFVPFLIYRIFALLNASYSMDRDHIVLQWGLRVESIPMSSVQWMLPSDDLQVEFNQPRIYIPGALLGRRRFSDGTTLELLASRVGKMLLIATNERVYAISPQNPQAFLDTFHQLTELGSLSSPLPQSVYPGFLFSQVWNTSIARYLILIGVLLWIIIISWVSLIIPEIEEVSLGFTPDGTPREPIPPIRLMLLPVLNSLIFLANFFLGVFLFRREQNRSLSYLLWINSVFVALLFLGAIYFITQAI